MFRRWRARTAETHASADRVASTPRPSEPPAPWPSRFLEIHLDKVAVSTVPLVLHPRTWIERRREYLEFLDEATMRREVRVDFAVPGHFQPLELRAGTSIFYAPIALVAKGKLRQLRVDDGSGAELAPMTSRDADKLACRILVLVAEAIVGELDHSLTDLLQDIVQERNDARKISSESRLNQRSQAQLMALARDSRFRVLTADLADNTLFVVPLVGKDPNDRVSVRYFYEEHVNYAVRKEGDRTEWLKQRLGWSPFELDFGVPSLGSALSYNIDIRLPEELQLESAVIYPLLTPGRANTTLQPLGSSEAHVAAEPSHEDRESSRIAHLRVQPHARGTRGFVRVGFGLESAGFLGTSFFASFLTICVLALGVSRPKEIGGATDPAATLLLGLPALLAGYLIRPGEHRLVDHLIRGVRGVLIVLFLLCFVAIWTLIADFGDDRLRVAWAVMLVLASGALAVTGRAWLTARTRERSRPENRKRSRWKRRRKSLRGKTLGKAEEAGAREVVAGEAEEVAAELATMLTPKTDLHGFADAIGFVVSGAHVEWADAMLAGFADPEDEDDFDTTIGLVKDMETVAGLRHH